MIMIQRYNHVCLPLRFPLSVSNSYHNNTEELDPILQILDRSTDIFEVLFVGSAVKYLFNEKPHILESSRGR